MSGGPGRWELQAAEALGELPEIRNDVSGTIYGPSIQAHNVHGNVYIHQRASSLPPPSQLPPPVRLTGRAQDLAAMDAARGSGTIVVTGQPGIGKSALAVNWCHGVRGDFPDGVLYEDLHGYAPDGPAPPGDALRRFVRALGVGPREVPTELAELAALYRSLLADKRVLVVLDDALTAAQVAPLLPPSVASAAVVTSRRRLGGLAARGARIIQVDKLGPEAALDLLGRTLGDDRTLAEPQAARDLVELCARVPLALCVAGARLAARSRWPISEMVDALLNERRRLAALAMEGDVAVRSALDVSYQSLEQEAARMYRLLGLYPGSRFRSGVAAAAAMVSNAEAKRLLGVLTDANLVDDAEGGACRFYDLTRLHAREVAFQEESAAARDTALRRMLDWYLAAVTSAGQVVTPYRHDQHRDIRYPPSEPARFPDAGSALEWLDHELPEVMTAARFAAANGFPAMVWQLADAMWPLFLYNGRYGERLEFDRLALQAARDGGDSAGEAKMLNRIGMAVMDLGQIDEADAYFHEALRAWERMGNRDRAAGCMRRLGFVAMARRRPVEAIGYFTRALGTYRELASSRHVALTLSDLGDALTSADRPAEAVASLREASSLLADIADPYNQALVLIRLGLALEHAGQHADADGSVRTAMHRMRDIGSARGEADSLVALGSLAEHAGRPAEARWQYAAAMEILTRISSPRIGQVRERLARLDDPGETRPGETRPDET
jgi:tetratricopeptide (TPR) repeat protein